MSNLERPRVEYRTPEDLVRDVRRGLVRVPQFQRGFKWEAADIVRLFDSLLQGYPIGNLLLWRKPAPSQQLHVGPLTIDAPAAESALWVVDGQQRIVSIVGALTEAHRSTDPRFRVHLDLDDGSFHTASLRQQVPVSWIPVSFLLDTATVLRWMRDNSEWLNQEQIAVADRAAKAIREYQIPTYVVSADREEPLLEIFTRMNTTGKRLTRSEVFQALHSDAAGDEPASLHDLGLVTASLDFGAIDDRLALRCVLAFRGGDIFRTNFAEEFTQEEDVSDTFREVASALRAVVEFLRGVARVPHVKLLPYSHVVPVLVRFVRLHGAPEGRAATLLRRWVWRGAVAGSRARGISVPDIRGQVAAVNAVDPLTAAQELLGRVQSFPDFTADLTKTHFSDAMTKLNVLGLLSANPHTLDTGQPVDLAPLLDQGSPLRSIVSGSADLARTIANRVVLGPVTGRMPQALATAAPAIASSHLVDTVAQDALGRGEIDTFLARRSALCAETIQRHVARMAEWGARGGRSMADVLRSAA